MSNGSAEAILLGCATAARRQGRTGTPIGSAVVAALDEHRLAAGPGMFGFDVDALPPFDQPEPRRLFAALVADVARDGAQDPCDPSLTGVAWHQLEPFYRCLWLSNLERLHDGIRASLSDEERPPPLRVDVPAPIRAGIEVMKLVERRRELRAALRGTVDDRIQEIALLEAILAHVRVAQGIFDARYRVSLLLDHAALAEALGRLDDAAASLHEAETSSG
jgi:hypothetical protein